MVRGSVGFAVVAAVLIVAGCESAPESSGPPPSPYTAGEHPKMNGEKDGVVVPVINVWNTVPPMRRCARCNTARSSPSPRRNTTRRQALVGPIDSGGSCAAGVPETSLKK